MAARPLAFVKWCERKFRKLSSRMLSLFLGRRTPVVAIDPNSVKKLLLLRPEGKFGDLVVSLPIAETLHRCYPDMEVAIFCSAKTLAMIEDDPRFAKRFPYRKHWLADIGTIRAIRRERFDVVIDLIINDSVTTAGFSHICGNHAKLIGAGKTRFAEYYDYHTTIPKTDDDHIIDHMFKLLAPFGIPDEKLVHHAPLNLKKSDIAAADQFADELRHGEGSRMLIGYNLSAGTPNKDWDKEKSRELIARLAKQFPDAAFVVFALGADREFGRELETNGNGRVRVMPKSFTMLQSAALITKLVLLVTPDTSLTHVARSFRVPVVALMPRPQTMLHRWRPLGQKHGAVHSTTMDNMADITVDAVMAMVTKVTSETAERVRG